MEDRASRGRLLWLLLAGASVAFAILVNQDTWWERLLTAIFPDEVPVLHPRAPLGTLVAQHVALVGLSSCLTILVAIPLGIGVTRAPGRRFLSITSTITALGQTFPPVAVLALAVPLTGFGLKPTVLALFLYGLTLLKSRLVAGWKARRAVALPG